MNEFEQYLTQYKIDPLTLSIAAKVRYAAVWNAQKGNPITSENAQKIKEAVLRLTGTTYAGSFVLIQESSAPSQLPTFPVRKLYKASSGENRVRGENKRL